MEAPRAQYFSQPFPKPVRNVFTLLCNLPRVVQSEGDRTGVICIAQVGSYSDNICWHIFVHYGHVKSFYMPDSPNNALLAVPHMDMSEKCVIKPPSNEWPRQLPLSSISWNSYLVTSRSLLTNLG